jgi:predicted NAD-dependent protein-ADP-ribosyltransferase YbiA (DUF1768 family)
MTTMYGPKWAPVKQREQRHPFENEFMSRTEHEGVIYPSAFHAYTAAKCARDRTVFTKGSVRRARELGKGEMVAGFTENRVRVMHSILRSKFFRDPGLARALLATGTDELRYDCKSPFWGYPGTNEHGKILVAVRDELRSIVDAKRVEMEGAEADGAEGPGTNGAEGPGPVGAAGAEADGAEGSEGDGAEGPEGYGAEGPDSPECADGAEGAEGDGDECHGSRSRIEDLGDWDADPDEEALNESILALP